MKTRHVILYMIFLGSWSLGFGQDETRPSCTDCHSDLLEREVIHYPAEDACDNCHLDPGEDHPDGGQRGSFLADSIPGLCYLCHDRGIHENTVRHAPDQNCISCHDPHGSANARLMPAPKRELCMDCHTEIKSQDRLAVKHFPFEDDCGNCHSSHSSPFTGLLAEAYPPGLYAPGKAENYALCFLCHDAALMEEDSTDWATGFRQGNRNLHYVHLQGEKGRSCKLCHSVHAATGDRLIAGSVAFGQWEMPLGFTLQENGGSCLTGCHSRMSYSREPVKPGE